MRTAARAMAAALCFAACGGAAGLAAATDGVVISLPSAPWERCDTRRARLFAACVDQNVIFAEARARADAEGKALLVAAGAEWCVWCHVLDATLKGFVDGAAAEADPTITAAADRLRETVAERFVLVHIDVDDAPSGFALLERVGADPHFRDWLPFLFAVDGRGRFAGPLFERGAETGGQALSGETDGSGAEPPGYDRALLTARIDALAAAVDHADAQYR